MRSNTSIEKTIIKCRCGKAFSACVTASVDVDFIIQSAKEIEKGCTMEVTTDPLNLEPCICPNMDGRFKGQLEIDFDQS